MNKRAAVIFGMFYASTWAAVVASAVFIKDPSGQNLSVLLFPLLILHARKFATGKTADVIVWLVIAGPVLSFFPFRLAGPEAASFSAALSLLLMLFTGPFITFKDRLEAEENRLKGKEETIAEIRDKEVAEAIKEDDLVENEIKDITSLYNSAKDLSHTMRIEHTTEAIIEILKKVFRASFKMNLDDVNFALIIKRHFDFHVASFFGYDEEIIKEHENQFVSSVIKNIKGKGLVYKTAEENEAGMSKSIMYIPFYVEEKLLGVMVLSSSKPNLFSEKQVESLRILSNQIAISIEKVHLYEEVEQMSILDSLTGLFVHRHFQEKLELELKRSARYGSKLSLIMSDIDFFKKINDTYGHLAGDYILKTMAVIFKNQTTQIDTVARYGGEEFVIVLPECDKDKAHALGVKIRKEVEKYNFNFKGTPIKVTVSMGVAEYPGDAIARRALVEKADKALYKAKQEGRNRVLRA